MMEKFAGVSSTEVPTRASARALFESKLLPLTRGFS